MAAGQVDAAAAALDLVLCKTRHAHRIFDALGCPTHYLGFTSEDRRDPDVPRERAFFHLAGSSGTKGTRNLMETWARHPHWPRLTVVQNPRVAAAAPRAANIEHVVAYLDDARLRRLQNAHLFHICPSETEGFGHYLMEAMSVGAIVLTTDAEPMNELVGPQRGLLMPAAADGAMRLAQRYRVDAEAIEATVECALALPPSYLQALSASARSFYERSDRAFAARWRNLLSGLLAVPETAVDVARQIG